MPWGASIQATKTAKAYDEIFRWMNADLKVICEFSPSSGMVALHADLENFGYSVPHETTLAVMKFFGMSETWLNWLKVYLEIPIASEVDGQDVVTKKTRGVPFSLQMSFLVNEALLAILDLAVVSKTKLWMHRNHDDYWMWCVDDEH